MTNEEIEELKNNSLSKIVILTNPKTLLVSRVFLQIPFDYGFAGAVGKKYEAIKDFLKWNNLDVRYWTPVLLKMGEIWINFQANITDTK